MRKILYWAASFAAVAGLYSCASIGNPSGGPRDEDPPRFVRANPMPGSTNVDPQKITIDFNELVNVKDAFTKVIVSPPSKNTPRVSSLGRRVTINFTDSLLPNTTYTVDFADAIEDNNEGNKLQNFTYTFSTGETLDSLMISGMVLGAHNSEPMQGILVGVHPFGKDSIFMKERFYRMARTDDHGRFTVRGLPEGLYSVFALDDKDNDFKYSSPEEDIAFSGAPVMPSTYSEETTDTIWDLHTGHVDTVVTRMRTVFTPNDVLIRSFNSEKKAQYIVDYQRQDSTRLKYTFNAPQKQPPILEILGRKLDNPFVVERSLTNDSLTYWLREPELIDADTLIVATTYRRLDSANNYYDYTDTLKFVTNRPKPSKKKEKKQNNKKEIKFVAEDSIRAITMAMKITSPSGQDVHLPLLFETDEPLQKLDTAKFKLLQKRDTTYVPVKKPWRLMAADSVAVRKFKIEYPWEYNTEYRLDIDTIAAIGLYGKPTRPMQHDFKTKTEDDYCALTFNITGFRDNEHTFVELLNSSDDPVRTAVVEDGAAYFPFLAPGKYYARIIEDFNGNGKYDTGSYELNIQPDMAYYYPKPVNLKKNWDKTEQWDVFATAIDLQKPNAIKKNKPEVKRGQKNEAETEEDEDEIFDPTRNPFDPNDRGSRRNGNGMNSLRR